MHNFNNIGVMFCTKASWTEGDQFFTCTFYRRGIICLQKERRNKIQGCKRPVNAKNDPIQFKKLDQSNSVLFLFLVEFFGFV